MNNWLCIAAIKNLISKINEYNINREVVNFLNTGSHNYVVFVGELRRRVRKTIFNAE